MLLILSCSFLFSVSLYYWEANLIRTYSKGLLIKGLLTRISPERSPPPLPILQRFKVPLQNYIFPSVILGMAAGGLTGFSPEFISEVFDERLNLDFFRFLFGFLGT